MGEMGTARAQPGHRMEHDLLGELAVPNDAYYGVHTTRALRNFATAGSRSATTRSWSSPSPPSTDPAAAASGGRLTGLHYLAAGVELLADRCLAGITANEAALRETAANSAGLATALSPYLGYAAASELARDAQAGHRPVRELAQERGLLPAEVIDALLADPHRLTGTACPQDATATRLSAEPPTTMTGGTA